MNMSRGGAPYFVQSEMWRLFKTSSKTMFHLCWAYLPNITFPLTHYIAYWIGYTSFGFGLCFTRVIHIDIQYIYIFINKYIIECILQHPLAKSRTVFACEKSFPPCRLDIRQYLNKSNG